MSNFYVLDQLAKSRQHDLRQEAKYAAQLRQLSSASRPVPIKAYWKLALGAAVLIAVVVMLCNGVAI